MPIPALIPKSISYIAECNVGTLNALLVQDKTEYIVQLELGFIDHLFQ